MNSEQYKTPDNLSTRISIHDKYSVNTQGFGNWIFEHYDLPKGCRILELGCGNGIMWQGRVPKTGLVLTDLSEGMIRSARELLGESPDYAVVNIEAIPFDAGSFDRVIANMMLYHVFDLDKALDEVCRVLGDDGVFYCATYGEHGIVPFLAERLGFPDNSNKRFTLQNGEGILQTHFREVQRLDYPDALRVTDVQDILDYLESLTGLVEYDTEKRSDFKQVLEEYMENGVLTVPKEYGLFRCRK